MLEDNAPSLLSRIITRALYGVRFVRLTAALVESDLPRALFLIRRALR